MIKRIILLIVGVVMIAGAILGMYLLAKEINYSLVYKSMVRETIREMVKEEALKQNGAYRCKWMDNTYSCKLVKQEDRHGN